LSTVEGSGRCLSQLLSVGAPDNYGRPQAKQLTSKSILRDWYPECLLYKAGASRGPYFRWFINHGSPSSVLGQSMWNSWWTNW